MDRLARSVKVGLVVCAVLIDTAYGIGIGLSRLGGGMDKGLFRCLADIVPAVGRLVIDAVLRRAVAACPFDLYALGRVLDRGNIRRFDKFRALALTIGRSELCRVGVKTAHGVGIGVARNNGGILIGSIGRIGDALPAVFAERIHTVQLSALDLIPADGDTVFVARQAEIRR